MFANHTSLEQQFSEDVPSIFQNIVANSATPILVTDSDLHVAYANLAASRLVAQPVLGQPLTSFWLDEDRPFLNDILEYARSSGLFSAHRLNGFHSVIDSFPGIEIVGTLAADWQYDKDPATVEDFLNANPPGTLDAIWAVSSGMALGAIEAIEATGRQDEVKVFCNDVTPETVSAIQSGKLIADTHHGFAEWGWYGARCAVMLALGQEVPPTFAIGPRTVYAGNAADFDPFPQFEPTEWDTIKGGHKLPEKIRIGWIQAFSDGPFQLVTDALEKAASEARAHGINVELITRVLPPDSDTTIHAAIAEDLVEQAVNVIVCGPFATGPYKEALRKANVAGIPIILVGRLDPLADLDIATCIGFDNIEAGMISAYALVDYLGGPGVLGAGDHVAVEPDTSLDLHWWRSLYQGLDPQPQMIRGRIAIISGRSENWQGENRLLRADKSIVDVDASVSPIHNNAGRFLGYTFVLQDATGRKQAEIALNESEARYRAIVESQVDLISRYRPDSILTYANDAYCQFYGKTREELVGHSYLAMVAPEFQEIARQETLDLATNPRSISGEYLNYKHDGTACWIQWMVIPIKDDRGQVVELQAIGRDVTRLKETEQNLRQSEERLRQAVSVGNIGILDHDRTNETSYFSTELRDILGYGPDDVVTLTSASDRILPEDRARIGEAVDHASRLGETGNLEMDLQVINTQGEIRWLIVRAHMFFTGEGEVRRLSRTIGAVMDITEQKQAEAKIQASEERLRQAVSIGNIGIFDYVMDQLFYASQEYCDIYGLGAVEIEGLQTISNLTHPDDRERMFKAIERAHDPAGDGLYDFERRIINSEGKIRWIHTISRSFFDGTGNRVRTIGAVMDITERKLAEAKIQASEERLRQATRVGNIGIFDHDITNNTVYWSRELRVIYGYGPDDPISVSMGRHHGYPEDRERVDAAAQAAWDPTGNGAFDIEYRIKDRQGSIHWISTRARTFFEGEGDDRHPVRTVGAVIDVTEQRRIEQALETERTMLRTLIDHIPYRVYVKDIEGRFMIINRAMKEYYSRWFDDPDDILGKTDAETFAPTTPDREQWINHYQAEERKILQTGQPLIEQEQYLPVTTGRHIWETVTKVPLFDRDNKAIGLVGINQDITDRKQVEEALRQTTQRLKVTIRAGNIGLWDWDLRTNEVYYSPEWKTQIGYAEHELEGIYETWESRVHPDDLERVQTLLRKNLSPPWPVYQVEFRLRHKDGSYRWILAHGAVEFDSDGQPFRMVGSHVDITDRKQAELKRQESEQMLKIVLDNIPIRVFWKDKNLRLLGCNRLFVKDSGLPSAEHLIGKNDEDLHANNLEVYTREELEKYRRDDCYVIDTGESLLNMEEPQTRQDGKEYWLYTSKLPLRNIQGDIIGVLGIYEDITDRKRAQDEIVRLNETLEQRVRERTQQLEAVNRELESFAYSVSHDLRTPLRSIDGFSLVLLEDYYNQLDDDGKDYLRRVRRATTRMSGLIDDLLQLSRVTRRELQLATVDLSALAGRIAASLREAQPGRQVEWVIEPGVEVVGDARLLRIALENLLNNAWKFTGKRDQARIEFGCVIQDGENVCFVRDNGAGFDMAHADKLFGAFQRLHHNDEFEGTGIGLATVQRIVRMHGGRVWAESEIGAGATFYFTLPVR